MDVVDNQQLQCTVIIEIKESDRVQLTRIDSLPAVRNEGIFDGRRVASSD